MNFVILRPARDEFREAILHYKTVDRELAVRFRNEVHRVIRRIIADPTLWRERAGGFRRVNCPVFPYHLAYIIRTDLIIIVAIAHGHRRPNYWKNRLAP
jgi:plasmid stabilization system protein ParE